MTRIPVYISLFEYSFDSIFPLAGHVVVNHKVAGVPELVGCIVVLPAFGSDLFALDADHLVELAEKRAYGLRWEEAE